MVSASTTCLGRFSRPSCTALPAVCGGTMSRSCPMQHYVSRVLWGVHRTDASASAESMAGLCTQQESLQLHSWPLHSRTAAQSAVKVQHCVCKQASSSDHRQGSSSGSRQGPASSMRALMRSRRCFSTLLWLICPRVSAVPSISAPSGRLQVQRQTHSGRPGSGTSEQALLTSSICLSARL